LGNTNVHATIGIDDMEDCQLGALNLIVDEDMSAPTNASA